MGTTTTPNVGYTKPDQAEKNTIVFQNNNWDLADLLAGQTVGKNVLINSNFSINQREVSGTVVLSASEYALDRWKAGSGGCTFTFSYSQNIGTVDISAGSLMQEVLGENLQTSTYILHWQGTATGRINVASFTASPQTGSITGGTNAIVEFGTGTLTLPKLEIGTIATTNIPDNFTDNSLKLQRYTYKIFESNAFTYPFAAAFGWSATEVRAKIVTPVEMRVNPTIVVDGGTILAVRGGGSNQTITAATNIVSRTKIGNNIFLRVTGLTGIIVDEAHSISILSGFLILDAEV